MQETSVKPFRCCSFSWCLRVHTSCATVWQDGQLCLKQGFTYGQKSCLRAMLEMENASKMMEANEIDTKTSFSFLTPMHIYWFFFFLNCVFQSWKKSVCCICFKYSFLLWITLWTQHWKEKYLKLQSSREYFHIKLMLYHCYLCLKSSAQYGGEGSFIVSLLSIMLPYGQKLETLEIYKPKHSRESCNEE